MKAKASTDTPTDQIDQTLTDQTRALYDGIAPQYDSHYTKPIHAVEDRATELLLAPFISMTLVGCPEPHIMDLGCGTGWLLDHFPEIRPHQYTGVDLSHSMLAAARAKHPEHGFIRSDLCDLTDVSVNHLVVSTFGTLSHLPAETWVPLLSKLASPGCSYFLTLLTPAALNRRSSLAHTHPHLIHPAWPVELQALLIDHGLPPGKMFGLNPWGDEIPASGTWREEDIEALAHAMLVDAIEDQETTDHHHLLGISGRRI